MKTALDCGEALPSTVEPAPDAVAAPTGGDGVIESNNVDLLLSRLVRAGLWRDGRQPEAEPAVVPIAPAAGLASQDAAPLAADESPAPALIMAPPSVPAKNAAEHSDDESIESYMDRLLKRVRGDSPAAAARAPSPPPVEAAPAPVAAAVVAAAAAEEKTEDSGEFLPRTTAPELPANLSAMRELANTAARTAIDRHVRKHTGRQAAGRLVGAGLTIATSVLLGYWAWKGHSIQAGVGAGLGAGVGIYWTLAALRRLFGTMRLNRPQEEAESPTVPGE